jgi:hypothetical protein
MKSSNHNLFAELSGISDDQQTFNKDTNPFQKSQSFGPEQKPGKRQRIYKPLYSVRLS